MTDTSSAWRADAALKRVSFVDRESDLDFIREHIPDQLDQPPVFLITAAGGMGKTELLNECLRRFRAGECKGEDWFAASEVVDFYHMDTHSKDGLALAIVRALGKDNESYFKSFHKRLAELNQRKGELAGLIGERIDDEVVAAAFVDDLERMTEARPLALAFDTAERLIYEPGEVQAALGINTDDIGVAVLPWLREFLPGLKNVVVLLAGRPQPETPEQLFIDLRAALSDRLVERELAGFDEDAANAYWEAIAQAAEEAGDSETARRIRIVDKFTRTRTWHLTDGRPILLSLAIHHVIRAERLLDELRPSAEIDGLEGEALTAARERFKAGLVREFVTRGLPSEASIRMLAWARRGLTIKLLTRLLGVTPEEAEAEFAILRSMAFVKQRPEDEALFLHDEMFLLLWEYLLQYDDIERDLILGIIVEDYAEQITATRKDLAGDRGLDASEAAASERVGRATRRNKLRTEMYRLMAEEVYYQLRHAPGEGFRRYYQYVKETSWAGQPPAMMELRDELLLFEREFDRWADDERLRNDILCESVLRLIDLSIRRGKYGEAIDQAERARADAKIIERFARAGSDAYAELGLLQGRAYCYAGQLAQAEEMLEEAHKTIISGTDKVDPWRRQALTAEILNDRGYTARQQGKLVESEAYYLRAIHLWREIGSDSAPEHANTLNNSAPEHANTLNNSAWVLAERGHYDEALRRCLDALKMRRDLGDDGPVAYSLNTLGLIEVRNDQSHRGEGHCRQALQICRDFKMQRGIGLACTARAEALRREALTPELYSPAEQRERLELAAKLTQEAIDIFSSENGREPMRLIEAQIELGCDYRDWARSRDQWTVDDSDQPVKDELYRFGQEAFRAAVATTGEGREFAHKRMEARINWAWLEYYMGHTREAEELLTAAIQEDAPPGYLICKGEEIPVDDVGEMPLFWMHLGKAELLHGRMAMQAFEEAEKPTAEADAALHDAAEHFTLALAYDHLFAPLFRDLRRGQDAIYDDLKGLNGKELAAFVAGAEDVAVEYLLKEPTDLQKFVELSFGAGVSDVDGLLDKDAARLHQLGHDAYQAGNLAASEGYYLRALRLWREIGKDAAAEHANTLNSSAWVLAELGRYDEALRRCLNALGIRRKLGEDGQVAVSLNTLGLIEVRNDQAHRGEVHCRQALQIFRDLEMPRSIGLACTARAEALRRQALTPELYSPAEQRERLQLAADLAQEAIEIFSSENGREPMRLIEAQLELGCDYRDWARIRGAWAGDDPDQPAQDELYRRGQEAFSAAVTAAGEEAGFAHILMNARINWAWLEYSMGNGEAAEELLKTATQDDTAQSYLISGGAGIPKQDKGEMPPLFWMHLGKAELLRGRMAMEVFKDAAKRAAKAEADEALHDAAEHFTLALAYDHQFAEMFRDLRRGQEAIYNDLKGLNKGEFDVFMAGAENAAEEYLLEEPTHLQKFVRGEFGVGVSDVDDSEELDL